MKCQLPANSLANRPRRPRYRAESPTFTNHNKIHINGFFEEPECRKYKKHPKALNLLLISYRITKGTHRGIRFQHGDNCCVNKCKKARTMLQTDGQWQDHENNVHIEDYKKETSEEVKDFSKEVPALIPKCMRPMEMCQWLSANHT